MSVFRFPTLTGQVTADSSRWIPATNRGDDGKQELSSYSVLPLPSVMPDVCYRASILRAFRMDPRHLPAGMTDLEDCHSRHSLSGIHLGLFQMDTCHKHAGMTEGGWITAPANSRRGRLTNQRG